MPEKRINIRNVYMIINLIPLALFYYWDCVLGIGISPFRPAIVVSFVVLDIIMAISMKDYLISSIMLYLSSIIGVILSVTYYYYHISNDFETPVVGAFIATVYAIGLLPFIGIGAVIVHFKTKK